MELASIKKIMKKYLNDFTALKEKLNKHTRDLGSVFL